VLSGARLAAAAILGAGAAVGAGQHWFRSVNEKTIPLGASTAGLSTVAVRAGHVNEDEGVCW
jgi:hypothetical protein